MLWFIQHYLWDLSNAPDIRRNETEAFEFGYNAVNEDLARAVLEEIEDVERPVVMVHDYHLYTLPGLIRQARPDAFLHHFIHIPWSQSDSWRVLPSMMRKEIFNGILCQRHHRLSHPLLPAELPPVLRGSARPRRRLRGRRRALWTGARCGSGHYPLPIDSGAVQAVAQRDRTRHFEDELLRRRRDHLILRVDRADLSKNVLRGFSAFDIIPRAASRVPREGDFHRPADAVPDRRRPSTPSTSSGSRRSSRSSTTATARRTGCRFS